MTIISITPLPSLIEILQDNPGWLDEAVSTEEASRIQDLTSVVGVVDLINFIPQNSNPNRCREFPQADAVPAVVCQILPVYREFLHAVGRGIRDKVAAVTGINANRHWQCELAQIGAALADCALVFAFQVKGLQTRIVEVDNVK